MYNEPVAETGPKGIIKIKETPTKIPIEEQEEEREPTKPEEPLDSEEPAKLGLPTRSDEPRNFPMSMIKIHTVGNESSSGTFARDDDELLNSVSERMADKIQRRGSLLRYKKAAREIDRSDRTSVYLNSTKQSIETFAKGD